MKTLCSFFVILISIVNLYSQTSSISMIGPTGNQVGGAAGTNFIIQVKVGDPVAVSNLVGVSFNLEWSDTSWIGGVNASAGSFFGSNTLFLAQNFANRFEIGVTSTTGGKNGTGVVALCTLNVKQSGHTVVQFNITNLSGMDGNGNTVVLQPQNNPLSIQIGAISPTITITGLDSIMPPFPASFLLNIRVGDSIAASNLVGISFNLEWQILDTTYISGDSAYAGSFFNPSPLFISQQFVNRFEIGVSSTSGGKSGSGVVAYCRIRIKQNIPIGTTVTFNLTSLTGIDGNGNAVTLIPTNLPYTLTFVPVELLSFSANIAESFLQLNWQTATETNNKGFNVERRIDNGWEKVGFVPGSGTTTEKRDYSFIDDFGSNPYSGVVQYRLKQIDFDGSFEYSNVISTEVDFKPSSYVLLQNYPNPFNPSTTIQFYLPEAADVTLNIYTQLGVKVEELLNQKLPVGVHTITYDADDLSTGVYFYELVANGNRIVKKLTLIK